MPSSYNGPRLGLIIGYAAPPGPANTPSIANASSTTSTTATFTVTLQTASPLYTTLLVEFDTNGSGNWVQQLSVAIAGGLGSTQSVTLRSLPAGTAYTGRFRVRTTDGGGNYSPYSTTASATTTASTGTNRAQQYMTTTDSLVFPATQQSTTLPTGTQQTSNINKKFQGTVNASGQSPFLTMLNNSNTQTAYYGKWVTQPLIAQTIPSGTYTFKFGGYIEAAGPVYNFAPVLYLYRPTTGAIIGTINDSATGLGTALVSVNTTTGGVVFTVSLGSGIVVNDADVLILEHYAVGSRTTGGAAIIHTQYNGSTAVTQLGSSNGAAAGVFFPSNISFNESP